MRAARSELWYLFRQLANPGATWSVPPDAAGRARLLYERELTQIRVESGGLSAVVHVQGQELTEPVRVVLGQAGAVGYPL